MKKEATSLYAGKIFIKIFDEILYPKSISIKKNISTVTDSFSFTIPIVNENGYETYIPNFLGLKIDVYVNDCFYVSGILLNRRVKNNYITCECSTHGWQLCNSDIYESEEYTGGDCLGDFIKNTCEKNFVCTYQPTIESIKENRNLSPIIKTRKETIIGENKQYTYKYFDNSKTMKIKKELQNTSDKIFNIILNGQLYKSNLEKKYIQFVLYDPFNLYNTKISVFSKKNKRTSSYDQTVFDYIKSITKNINVFVKCIGLYSDIKEYLVDQYIYPKPNNTKETIVYVLLLYRPGIDADIYNPLKLQYNLKQSIPAYGNWSYTKMPFLYTASRNTKWFTYAFMELTGYVTNDGTDNSNCLEELTEEYSGSNEYSVYILRNKEGQFLAANGQGIYDKESIETMRQKDLYFNKSKYLGQNLMGNIKNIFVEENLTEYAASRRLNYEINAMRAESYRIQAKVIGYTIDMNFAKVNYCEEKQDKFWEINRKVIVNSPAQGINNLSLIVGELEINYDSDSGAYTNLTLIPPLSYNASELNTEDFKKEENKKILEKKKEEAKIKKIDFTKNTKIIYYKDGTKKVELLKV